MKILHKINEHYIQKCDSCNAVLQYTNEDILIKNELHYSRPGSFCASMDCIVCPACGKILVATREWFYDNTKEKQ